jgi:hypothetical protein
MQKLHYPNHPIYSIKSLALLLNVAENDLKKISNQSTICFHKIQRIKKDCSIRECYSIREPLKSIHIKIREKITSKVSFPSYIQGSTKGFSNITNAKLHENSKTIIQLDVKNFFPSISYKHIYNLWHYFFHFSKDVSRLLTNIITLNNYLVQGSTLSSDIANLIFWDNEYELVMYLNNLNLIYSRYVDDISISSKEKIPNNLKTTIIKKVNRMLSSKELKLKNKKTIILNENNQMLVTGLVVNKKTKVSKSYIDKTYKEIIKNTSSVNSINGKIQYIKQTSAKKAKNLNKANKS